MKKILTVAFVLLISFAFVSMGFAQPKPAEKAPAPEKAAAPEKAPAPEKAASAEKSAKPKPKVSGFVGTIAKTDARTFTVKAAKTEVTFDASNPKFKGYKAMNEMKAGDKVAAKYTKDGVWVQKIAGAKAEKKAVKPAKMKKGKMKAEKAEKKAEKKAEEPAKEAPAKK
jgi:hypothetical protein